MICFFRSKTPKQGTRTTKNHSTMSDMSIAEINDFS